MPQASPNHDPAGVAPAIFSLYICLMQAITDLSQLNPEGTYSYADYLSWRFEQAVELFRGHILKMSAPNRRHQQISFRLSGIFFLQFRKGTCEAYTAPFDVRLPDRTKAKKANEDVFTVVQPDLCVVCDKDKLDEKGCIGAPDLVVEILSAGNSKKEMRLKKDLYEENGVREYWIIDPERETLHQYTLQENGIYTLPSIFLSDDTVTSTIFSELQVPLSEVFGVE